MKASNSAIGYVLVYISLGLILLSLFTGTNIFRQEFTDEFTSVFEVQSNAWFVVTLVTALSPFVFAIALFSASMNFTEEDYGENLRSMSQYLVLVSILTAILAFFYFRNPLSFDTGDNARWVRQAILYLHVFSVAFGYYLVKIKKPSWLQSFSTWAVILTLSALSRDDFRFVLAITFYVLQAFIGYVLMSMKEEASTEAP